MSIAPYLKEIGRGKDGARSLDRTQATDLMGRILAGEVSDLQLGGFALAMRIKGESAVELAGFLDATALHTRPLVAPGTAVLLPSYNGARRLPNFTPLLALLLARRGVPVLVHGPLHEPGRVTSAEIFTELGLPPVQDAQAAAERWARNEPVFMSLEDLNAPLARLLALRRVLGLRNSGHTLAKILPAVPGALRVINHTHPEYAVSLAQYLRDTAGDALLMRGTEGEPVADARRLPRMEVYLKGETCADLGTATQDGALTGLPELPGTIDAVATAAHITAVLGGQAALPEPIRRQAEVLANAVGRLTARAG